MSQERRERREQEREAQKSFETLAKDIRTEMDDCQDEEFKNAVLNALSVLDTTEHANNVVAAQLILGCIAGVKRGDMLTSRLMLFISGAIVNETICHATLTAITGGIQMRPVTSPPPV